MKRFKEVEATRRAYHQDAGLNSVHRSSLLVPEMPGAEAEISFVNHFLIKRGYGNVACRVTAIDPEGRRLESRLHPITEPRVYTVPLSGMVADPVATYLVEFFAAENLFIPFPAVMVNHRGPGFLNTVHAYNRVLNDVFEDDAVNAVKVREASIDTAADAETDTFVLFSAGQSACRGEVEIELLTEAGRHAATVPVEVPRFANRRISLREALPGLAPGTPGVLKVRQPAQFLFYGRMLAGQRRSDGAFTANHSYYDSSETEEYWEDGRPSARRYPFFAELENRIRMYPVMSRGVLRVGLDLHGRDGALLAELPAGELESPGARYLDVSVNRLAEERGIAPGDVSAFAVRAEAARGGVPTRVNHQLVQGAGGLQASINVSLHNPNVFTPEGKTGFTWGQVPVGGGVRAWLGIVNGVPGRPAGDVEAVFYGVEGELARRRWRLPAEGALVLDAAAELAPELARRPAEGTQYVWYSLAGAHADLSAFVASRHDASGHCCGEHSF